MEYRLQGRATVKGLRKVARYLTLYLPLPIVLYHIESTSTKFSQCQVWSEETLVVLAGAAACR